MNDLVFQRRMKSFAGDLQKWNAVRRRDARADGHFFFGVCTTGIYCRPSCKSRLPLRRHVTFHASSAAAEDAGFRPCKRCQPNGSTLALEHSHVVSKICRLIEAAVEAPPLAALARSAHMSTSHFRRVFVRTTGLSPKAYHLARRAEATRKNLGRSPSVTSAIYQSGFASSGRFYAGAARDLGMRPRAYLLGGQGEILRYAVARSSLGLVLVATTDRGPCAILLGDDSRKLQEDVRRRFPKARLVPAGAEFAHTLKAVLAVIENATAPAKLPLDIRGTLFQHKVWRALAEIPAGKTCSYAQLARRIGKPTAVRAVAAACAANPLAVAIPCHRAVRSNGELAGFRWGLERKRALLRREARSG